MPVVISFVRDGTPRILARLKAELAAGAPKADCLLIADSLSMEELKREGLLLAYDKADISAFPAGIHDRLVSGLLRERQDTRGHVHVVLGLEQRPSSARVGADPEPEEELGQFPAGKDLEFSLPLLLVPGPVREREAIGGISDEPGAHPWKPVHTFADQYRNENRGEYEDDDGHWPTPHPGWRTGPSPWDRSRPLRPG